MLILEYTSAFLRRLRKLPLDVQERAIQKIALFKYRANHRMLLVHKLYGNFADSWAFDVDWKIRGVFKFLPNNHVLMESIGNHNIAYRKR